MQHLQAAVQAHQRDDLDCAEVLVKKILAVNSKNANALHLLGCIYKDLGHSQRAVELIQASIREDGGNPLPYLNLGKIFFAAGQYENAAEFFQESLKRNKQISETWFCLGNAFKKIRTIEDAKNAYQNALQLNPTHAGAASNLGALLAEGGDLEEAEKLLLRALEYSPNNVSLRINYGKLLADKGDNSAAIIQYRIALPFASHSYELHYNLANALKEEGDLQESIASYRKAVELRPDSTDAYLSLANAFMAAGEIDDSIASFQKAIELNPDLPDAYLNLGNVLKKVGDAEKAIASYRTSIDLSPGSAVAYLNLGIVLKEQGDSVEAIASFRKAIQLKSDLADAYLHLGNALREGGDVDEAIANYQKAVEVNPCFAPAYFNLGNVMKEEQKVDDAVTFYRKALAVQPDFVLAMKALAQCQGENGIREQVSLESYRGRMQGADEAGILIGSFPSFDAIPSTRRSVNSWIEDKNQSYFSGRMFGDVFLDLPWVKAKSYAERSSSLLPASGEQYLDAVDVYHSQIKTSQIRMSQAPVISSLVESIARKKGGLIDVIDVGGWSANALFLAGFNDSWDVVKSWEVVETEAVCVPAQEQLPGLIESFPEGSSGKRNLSKLSFCDLASFYGGICAPRNVDLIWSSNTQHYNASFPRDMDFLLSHGADLVYFDTLPYLCSSNPTFNVCEFTELGVYPQMVSFLMSQKYLTELVVNAANKYGYSFKLWSQYIEPKLVFWQPQDSDQQLPNQVMEDANPLLMKVCSIRFDKFD